MRISEGHPICRHPVDGNGLRRTWRRERDRDAAAFPTRLHGAARERQLQLVATVTIQEIPGHAARAVSAGLAKRAVGVVDHDRPAASLCGADDENAIGSDPAAAVAYLADPRRGELDWPIDHDEVVPAAVHLGELHAAASRIFGSGSAAVGSNQRIAASLRNQVIWRRE